MSMLKKATNKMAYAKVGIYGGQGAGKSRTAAEIAIGLYKHAKLTKPVAMFDTEPGASFLIPLFERAGIEFMVYDESRAFSDRAPAPRSGLGGFVDAVRAWPPASYFALIGVYALFVS